MGWLFRPDQLVRRRRLTARQIRSRSAANNLEVVVLLPYLVPSPSRKDKRITPTSFNRGYTRLSTWWDRNVDKLDAWEILTDEGWKKIGALKTTQTFDWDDRIGACVWYFQSTMIFLLLVGKEGSGRNGCPTYIGLSSINPHTTCLSHMVVDKYSRFIHEDRLKEREERKVKGT